ncbi:MAG TPA: CDP-alcohol phosphatidyltransferase family protein, partial [Prolixibacteraceae bacterium]|nr:CDP-alcohol phosphatidyltransferase family protein [Prolixibacteraceae bacterium]
MVITEKNKWYAFVPNMVTIFNLLCGTCGLYFAFLHRIDIAISLMAAGALFDFADGFVARLLKVSGELGKQLDSLADVVTFGLLPGAMIFSVQHNIIAQEPGFTENFSAFQLIILISPLIIPALSALRLAKFNIDVRQSNEFLGLPTPANALFFGSIAYSASYINTPIAQLIGNSNLILALTLTFPI